MIVYHMLLTKGTYFSIYLFFVNFLFCVSQTVKFKEAIDILENNDLYLLNAAK